MAESPLSPSSLAEVPEVVAAYREMVQAAYWNFDGQMYGKTEQELRDRLAADQLAYITAIRDATLKAERSRLLALTPEAVVEEAAKAMAARDENGHDFWDEMSEDGERADYRARVRAALPVLLGPEVARREAAEKRLLAAYDNNDQINQKWVLARDQKEAAVGLWESAKAKLEAAERERDEARRWEGVWRERLQKFGQHKKGCRYDQNVGSPYTHCSCGLESNGDDSVEARKERGELPPSDKALCLVCAYEKAWGLWHPGGVAVCQECRDAVAEMTELRRLAALYPRRKDVAKLDTDCEVAEARATAAEAERDRLRGALENLMAVFPAKCWCDEAENPPCYLCVARAALEATNG